MRGLLAGHDAQAMQAQAQARAVEAQASVYVAQQQAQAAVATAGLSGAGAVEHHAAPVAPPQTCQLRTRHSETGYDGVETCYARNVTSTFPQAVVHRFM